MSLDNGKGRQRLGASSLGTAGEYLQELEGRHDQLMNAVEQAIFA